MALRGVLAEGWDPILIAQSELCISPERHEENWIVA